MRIMRPIWLTRKYIDRGWVGGLREGREVSMYIIWMKMSLAMKRLQINTEAYGVFAFLPGIYLEAEAFRLMMK